VVRISRVSADEESLEVLMHQPARWRACVN
jgi:hypothetical protein